MKSANKAALLHPICRTERYTGRNLIMNKMSNSVHDVKENFTSRPLRTGEANAVSLFDKMGNRKYLTSVERHAFLEAADAASPDVRTFLFTLAYTGARLSEVLSLTRDRIDFGSGFLIIESLKKRKRGIFRAVPVPATLLDQLRHVNDLRTPRTDIETPNVRLWVFCRTTAWQHVKFSMKRAGIVGPHASPKALRHAFAVNAIDANVPLTTIQKWLGHSRLTTTAIYTNAVGSEERSIAQRYWNAF